ncbi:MAG TPA: NAD(P)/FAD-dependent oxidoreductase [Mycobacteriales bacterium]|nr:NAD(P)/FAD-dependent oxidoreductase [Mycobacteriales bacterium]
MPQAVVVGAGPGGLAAAAMLKRRGIDTEIVERADAVASAWRGHYERLHLHTVRWLSNLPGYRIPRAYGPWVARDDVVRYLEAYAAHHDLKPTFGTTVDRIDREAGRWVLRSAQGDRATRNVVVATGHNHTPMLPDWPGASSFTGELLHASKYRNAAPYVGKDVLVVGSGNTGAEIALDLVESGAGRVRLAIRTPPHIVLRQQGIVYNPSLGLLARHLPPKLFDPVALRMRRLTVGDLSRFGLPDPPEGLLERVRRDDQIPLVDMGFLKVVKAGQVEIVAGVTGFDGAAVTLADDTSIKPQVVIAATGYRRGLEPLVGHLGVLNAAGRPSVHGTATHPAAPNLWFTGFTNPVSGMFREMGIDARKIARAVARQEKRR